MQYKKQSTIETNRMQQSVELEHSTITQSGFGRNFYIANLMEIFERLAWYGFFAVSSIYMTTPIEQGGVGFSNIERGAIQGIIPFFLYLLPVLTGAIADHYGYKRMFIVAFAIMAPGYFLLGQANTFWQFFFALSIVAFGAACFKPVVVGVVSTSTNDSNRGLGFGIFYTMVNIGGFLGPIVAGMMRTISWDAVFLMSSCWILINFIPVLLWFKTEQVATKATSLKTVLYQAQSVIGNARFALLFVGLVVIIMLIGTGLTEHTLGIGLLFGFIGSFCVWEWFCLRDSSSNINASWWREPVRLSNPNFLIYLLILTGFWTVYNQLFYTLPIYIRDYVDTRDLIVFVEQISPVVADFLSHIDVPMLTATLQAAVEEGNQLDINALRDSLVHAKILLPQIEMEQFAEKLNVIIADPTNEQQFALLLNWLLQFRQINPEYLINLDFAAIILMQVAVSRAVAQKNKIAVLIAGLLLTVVAFIVACFSQHFTSGGALIVLVIVLIAFGEMFTSPKSQEYVATIAPQGQSAMYMGYYFVSMALGFLFAGFLSGWSYELFVKKWQEPTYMWLLFAGIAVITSVLFFWFDKRLKKQH